MGWFDLPLIGIGLAGISLFGFLTLRFAVPPRWGGRGEAAARSRRPA